MATETKAIECLNSLLRGELAAAETYRQALDRVEGHAGAAELRNIRDDHDQAAAALRRFVHLRGGEAQETSAAWGAFAKAVEGTAKLFGNTAALKALKEGEEHGVKQYDEALEDEDIPLECGNLIRTKLLPQTRAHIPVLDRLMQAQ